jgi:hypothetical protein
LFYLPRNEERYSLDTIKENAVCQPVMANSHQTYQWGFSVIQLETTLVLLTAWTLGTWLLWLHAHHELSSRGRYEVPQDFKAALYLADSIRADLRGLEQEADFLTNKELGRSASEHLKGGKVRIRHTPTPDNSTSCRRRSWRWVKTNKLWLFMFFGALATCFFLWGNSFAILTMSFATAAGWGRKTRAVMSWAAFVFGTAIFLPLFLAVIGVV